MAKETKAHPDFKVFHSYSPEYGEVFTLDELDQVSKKFARDWNRVNGYENGRPKN